MTSPIKLPGIVFDPNNYARQLEQKVQQVTQLLGPFSPPAPHVIASERAHFRMRAEFRIWHETKDQSSKLSYVMFDAKKSKQPVKVEQFPIANTVITNVMPALLDAIQNVPVLSTRLFQVEFLSTTTQALLVSLIYHKKLDENWEQVARALQHSLGIAIIGRARKQKLVLLRDYVKETLTINRHTFHYQQKENSFTQPNAHVNAQMIGWIADYFAEQSQHKTSDLLELYCGNGNFTLPLAQHFRRVLATEVSKTSIQSAQYNCSLNDINNIFFARLSSAETASALAKEREFRRLANINLDEYTFSAVFVDPPRAGLDDQTIALVRQFSTIAYISCNPETLASNLTTLSKTHRIVRFGVFDQFPYTPHCECGVILVKK